MIIKRWTSGSVTQTFNTTSGSNSLTAGNTANIKQGANITGAGIPAGTVVGAITSSTALTMINGSTGLAANATATATGISVTFDGGYLPDSAKTNATDLVVDVTALTPVSVFEGSGSTLKIKPAYLPNSVFDSLYFFTTAGATQPAVTNLTTLASNAFIDAAAIGRSPLGYYWVQGSSAAALFAANPTGTELVAGKYYKTIWGPAEENEYSPITSVELEIGDWLLISKISGIGTGDGSSAANAIVVTFAVVNNTYELMVGATSSVAGAPGLVPGPGTANRLQFLRGDGAWATPTDTNTTYTISTLNGDDSYSEKIRLASSASVNDDVAIAVGATQLTQRLGTLQSNTTVLITNTAGLLVGQLVTGTGIPANTLITSIVADTSISISNAATSSGNQTLTFSTFGLTIEQASDVITVKHADTSSASDLAASGRRYVTGLTFDTFGHVIGYTTATETVTDTNTATAADDILDGSNTGTEIKYAPYAAAAAGKFSSATPTTGTTVLGYSGHFYANQLFDNGSRVLTSQNTSKNIVGASSTATADAVATNGNVHINHLEASTVTSFHKITGAGATTVTSDASGNITITSTDTNTTYSAGNGISLSTTTFSVAAGVGLTQEASGLKMTQPFISSTTVPAATYQVLNNLWFDIA